MIVWAVCMATLGAAAALLCGFFLAVSPWEVKAMALLFVPLALICFDAMLEPWR